MATLNTEQLHACINEMAALDVKQLNACIDETKERSCFDLEKLVAYLATVDPAVCPVKEAADPVKPFNWKLEGDELTLECERLVGWFGKDNTINNPFSETVIRFSIVTTTPSEFFPRMTFEDVLVPMYCAVDKVISQLEVHKKMGVKVQVRDICIYLHEDIDDVRFVRYFMKPLVTFLGQNIVGYKLPALGVVGKEISQAALNAGGLCDVSEIEKQFLDHLTEDVVEDVVSDILEEQHS